MGSKELEYIKEVFETNYIAPIGKFIDKFENSVKEYTQAKAACATVNGTAALHLALRVLDIKMGDKVICSSFTFIGSVAPVLYQNAEPIFIDSDESWNMDVNFLEEAIKKESPRAIIVTHLYGQMAKVEEIVHLCEKHGIYLIEDAAEALGATYKGKHAGTFGVLGIYSFNGNKILTTGGGGMLVSNDEKLINKARFLSTQAKDDYPWYEHSTYGYNYRLSNVLAAIGVAQMEVIDERVRKRREIFEFYRSSLSDVADFMPEIEYSRGNRWLTTLVFRKKNPLEVLEKLKKNGIEARPLWKPMHLQPVFKKAKSYTNGTSENLFKKGLCLPSGTTLTEEQLKQICDIVKG